MIILKCVILFENNYWVGLFERIDKKGYSAAKHIFGKEPTDPEIYKFVNNHFDTLKFGQKKDFQLKIKRQNPKRIQRQIKREMKKLKQTTKPSTFAQDYMRQEIEKGKKEKKQNQSKIKQERKKQQFLLKQEKMKKKHKGH